MFIINNYSNIKNTINFFFSSNLYNISNKYNIFFYKKLSDLMEIRIRAIKTFQ